MYHSLFAPILQRVLLYTHITTHTTTPLPLQHKVFPHGGAHPGQGADGRPDHACAPDPAPLQTPHGLARHLQGTYCCATFLFGIRVMNVYLQ